MKSHIIQNHHVLAVPDKRISADYFIRKLGFAEVFCNEGWIFVQRDRCMIMLGECRDAIPPEKLGDHQYFSYLLVDDADAYWLELQDKGVDFTMTIADKPWNMREFGIRTPEGYRIMVGHVIA